MKRSSDGGESWSNLSVVLKNANNPTAVWDARRKVVMLQFNRHPDVLSIVSVDNGRTWTPPINVTKIVPGLPRDGRGVTVGPGVGLQLSRANKHAPGRLLFIGHHGPYTRDLVWFTDDGGLSYQLAQSNLTFMDEAQLVELPDGRVMANMRNHHKNATCKCRAVALSSDGGATWGEVAFDPQLISPICMATILRGRGDSSAKNALFFANPATTRFRTNGLIRRSDDEGATWSTRTMYVGDPFTYSCLTHTPHPETLGLLWETWEPVGGKHCNGEACSCVFSRFPATL